MTKYLPIIISGSPLFYKEMMNNKIFAIHITLENEQILDDTLINGTYSKYTSDQQSIIKLKSINKLFITDCDTTSINMNESCTIVSPTVDELRHFGSKFIFFSKKEVLALYKNIKTVNILLLTMNGADDSINRIKSDILNINMPLTIINISIHVCNQIDDDKKIKLLNSRMSSGDIIKIKKFWLPLYYGYRTFGLKTSIDKYDYIGILHNEFIYDSKYISVDKLFDNNLHMCENLFMFAPRKIGELLSVFYNFCDNTELDKQIKKYITETQHLVGCKVNNLITEYKKKIVVVTYYGYIEQLSFVEKALIEKKFELINFSLYEERDQNPNYIAKLNDILNIHKPEYILWWTINISVEDMRFLKENNASTQFLYYNWDEPFNYAPMQTAEKKEYIDFAFITCIDTINLYKKAICLYPGFCPSVHKPLKDITYICDISIICTNLYDGPEYMDQLIERKLLLLDIYNNQETMGYKFNIYGPENLKILFPNSYQNLVNYYDTNTIFNHSRINISTHVVGSHYGYLNERVFMIMASGGLLFVDPVKNDVLIDGINCVNIDSKRYIGQISDIINNYSDYEKIKNKALETSKQFTWSRWAETISNNIKL